MASFAGVEIVNRIMGVAQPYKIYDSSAGPKETIASLVPGLKIKNATIVYSAQIANHPTEDGKVVSEHKVIEPRTVQVEGFCTDKNAFSQMETCFLDREKTYGIQVKEIIVQTCVFGDFVPVRDSKVLSAIPVSFTMHELLEITGTTGLESGSVKNPSDADTTNRGTVNGVTPPADQARTMESSGV